MKQLRLSLKSRIKIIIIGCLAISLFALTACGLIVNYNIDEVELNLGLQKEYKIVFVNDLHMQVNSDEIEKEQKDFMTQRIGEFSYNGMTTYENWQSIPRAISKLDADFVIFGGDILDFCSEANAEALKDGFSQLKTPYMYLRSDHDVEPYWLSDTNAEKCMNLQNNVADNSSVLWQDLGEVIVLGINNSHNNISEEALEIIKNVFAMGKPVIVATHIPFDQSEGTELKEFSERVRDGRHLYWGVEGEKYPNEYTQEFMSMIYAEESPVIAVLAGHLHDGWEGTISNNTIEHIFGPCYKGNIGVVTCR